MTYTFSDGLTLAGTNVTNRLVTGASVAQVTMNSAGDIQLLAGGTAGILLDTTGGGSVASDSITALAHLAITMQAQEGASALNLDTNVDLSAAGTLALAGGAAGTLTGVTGVLVKATGAAGDAILQSDLGTAFVNGGTATVLQTNAGDITITNTLGAGDIKVQAARDELHTVGRNFTVDAAGAAGSRISALNGNLTLEAGPTGGTGELRLQPTGGTPAATRTFRIWNGAGAGQQTVTSPGGGSVVDVECRTQLGVLLEAMFAWGWIPDPNP